MQSYTECLLRKKTAGRSSECKVQFSGSAWKCWASDVIVTGRLVDNYLMTILSGTDFQFNNFGTLHTLTIVFEMET